MHISVDIIVIVGGLLSLIVSVLFSSFYPVFFLTFFGKYLVFSFYNFINANFTCIFEYFFHDDAIYVFELWGRCTKLLNIFGDLRQQNSDHIVNINTLTHTDTQENNTYEFSIIRR